MKPTEVGRQQWSSVAYNRLQVSQVREIVGKRGAFFRESADAGLSEVPFG
jgi:hypothetical protein